MMCLMNRRETINIFQEEILKIARNYRNPPGQVALDLLSPEGLFLPDGTGRPKFANTPLKKEAALTVRLKAIVNQNRIADKRRRII